MVLSWEDHQNRDDDDCNVGQSEDQEHLGYVFVDVTRELPINCLLVVRVDDRCAHLTEHKSADAEAANDDSADEAWRLWEPEPSVVHWDHVSEPIAQAKSD